MVFDTTQIYRLSTSLYLKEDGDGLLVLDPNSYSVHELNQSAAIVARLCNGKNTCEKIVAVLVEDHGEETAAAAEIAYRTLNLLHDQGLLECG
jgi:hypothetical protein